MAFIVILMVLSILTFVVSLYVLIGTWVHRDAKSKGLNPAKWTLIALLVPNFIGLIIYLVYRSDKKPAAVCQNCHGSIDINASFCPLCGYQAPPVREMHIHRKKKSSAPLIIVTICSLVMFFFSVGGLIYEGGIRGYRYSYYNEPYLFTQVEQAPVATEYFIKVNTVSESSSDTFYSFQFDSFAGSEKKALLKASGERYLYCTLSISNGSGDVVVIINSEEVKPTSWNTSSNQDSYYAEFCYDLMDRWEDTEIEVLFKVTGDNPVGYLQASLTD